MSNMEQKARKDIGPQRSSTSFYTATEKQIEAESKIQSTCSIGTFGSVSLLLNNMTGGGLVLFPALYQQAGWLICTAVLLVVLFLTIICGLMTIETMALLPGNSKFQRRVEYTTVGKELLNHKSYLVLQLLYQLSLAGANMAMIIQSVQVVDFIAVAAAGRSCALPAIAPVFRFYCPDPVSNGNTPFTDTILVSLGWYVLAVCVIPLSMVNLEDNVFVQKGAGMYQLHCDITKLR